MKFRHLLGVLSSFLLQAVLATTSAHADDAPARTVVLVHGAFADGSSWAKVIPYLDQAGLKVVAVQNPLDSLPNDVDAARRAIRNAQGPVVLVGHSWAGVVITEAGIEEKVKSLVYVAAYAPDSGETASGVSSKYPAMPSRQHYHRDGDGYLLIDEEGIRKYFAADLPSAEQTLVYVTQGPLHTRTLATPVSKAAWRDKPTFIVVATNDAIISPQLQKDQVAKTKATSIELPSSHVAMLKYPKEVAELIIKAAR